MTTGKEANERAELVLALIDEVEFTSRQQLQEDSELKFRVLDRVISRLKRDGKIKNYRKMLGFYEVV